MSKIISKFSQGQVIVNTTPQITSFRGAKRVHKIATGKSYDELLQHDNKLRIWTRSGNFRKVEKLWLGDKAQRECQWQHLCLRDSSQYERQGQHLCLRGTSQCVHQQPLPLSVVLPHLFLFLKYLKSVVNLHNSCNESVDSTDEFSLSTVIASS